MWTGLVPVVVSDKSGRYLADLTAEDFTVYEDDVLQNIVAVSRSPVSLASLRFSVSPDSQVTTATAHQYENDLPIRTYLICLYTLHSGFDNFARVRKALKEFFVHEESGDSQYALFALGRHLHVLVDSTRDPSTVLSAIGSKTLLKTIHDSEAASLANEVERLVRQVGRHLPCCDS
jgi:hypothetical protein